MTSPDGLLYPIDDLRPWVTALGAAAGLGPARAARLAHLLLWFDAAGAHAEGIATLPDWLERIEHGQVDPRADGAVGFERAGTVVLDGQNGLAPLILERAAGLAAEKARELGVGIVRVANLTPSGSAAAIAGDIAIGPEVGLVLGPGPALTLALPSAHGLPVLFDSALAAGARAGDGLPPMMAGLAAIAAALTPAEGRLVAALAVKAMEPLEAFQDRVSTALAENEERPGLLLPGPWEARRRAARERGIAIPAPALDRLRAWAGRFGLAPPAPRPA